MRLTGLFVTALGTLTMAGVVIVADAQGPPAPAPAAVVQYTGEAPPPSSPRKRIRAALLASGGGRRGGTPARPSGG